MSPFFSIYKAFKCIKLNNHTNKKEKGIQNLMRGNSYSTGDSEDVQLCPN